MCCYCAVIHYILISILPSTSYTPLSVNQVNFTSLIYVVPNITNNWIFTALCPCYDWDSGFNLTLTWPSAAHPPWNATLIINSVVTQPDGVVTSSTVVGKVMSTLAALYFCVFEDISNMYIVFIQYLFKWNAVNYMCGGMITDGLIRKLVLLMTSPRGMAHKN